MKRTQILILGAGCAGTSLAHYLEQNGFAGKIDLLDARTTFDREQRWCHWAQADDADFAPLVSHRWRRWSVADDARSLVRSSADDVYQQIYAPDFFRYFHRKWLANDSPINLHLGEIVQLVEIDKQGVTVATDRGEWRAEKVFDARFGNSESLLRRAATQPQKAGDTFLHQTFLGWVVEFDRPVFNVETAVLMDFGGVEETPENGVSFFYALPYTPHRALVESTDFGLSPLGRAVHSRLLSEYLRRKFGADFRITAEEAGALPMTTRSFAQSEQNRLWTIGVAGGGARPSSGYAFHRIQRHTRQIAAAVASGAPVPTDLASRKYDFFDAVFLRALARDAKLARRALWQLFERVEPAALVRFLSDESTLADDLKVVAALPVMPFARTALELFAEHSGAIKDARENENRLDSRRRAVAESGFGGAARAARG